MDEVPMEWTRRKRSWAMVNPASLLSYGSFVVSSTASAATPAPETSGAQGQKEDLPEQPKGKDRVKAWARERMSCWEGPGRQEGCSRERTRGWREG